MSDDPHKILWRLGYDRREIEKLLEVDSKLVDRIMSADNQRRGGIAELEMYMKDAAKLLKTRPWDWTRMPESL